MMASSSVITVPAFVDAGTQVRHFFGTRRHAMGLGLEMGIPRRGIPGSASSSWTLSVKQVHGTEALVVDRVLAQTDRFVGGWDALVTDQPGITVAVRTADCVPILMHDPQRRVVAAVHAGWRGAVAGIVPKTLALLRSRFGSRLEHVRISIGPSAGVCCYEVDEPVLDRLYQGFSDWKKVVRIKREGRSPRQRTGASLRGVSELHHHSQCLYDLPQRPLFFLPAGGEGQRDHGQCHRVADEASIGEALPIRLRFR
jgi:polyphenol oxidase